jgi:hypothetical protein
MIYHVEIAPGCHSGALAPIVSRHRTWEAAVRKARTSDRYVAVNTDTGERFQIEQRNSPRVGSGRYGNA